MPRPDRDMALFSVWLPRDDLERLRLIADNMTIRGDTATSIADLIRGMVRVGLGAYDPDDVDEVPAPIGDGDDWLAERA